MRALLNFLFLLMLVSTISGCSTIGKAWKGLVGGNTEAAPTEKRSKPMTKFSDNGNVGYDGKNRSYQRMTREKMEEDSRLTDNRDGSLWIMEGQGSYLFTSNTLRLVGDTVSVKLEGAPKNQLETKVKVIKQLLAKLDKPKRMPAAKPGAPGQPPAPPPAPGQEQQQPPGDQAANDKAKDEKDKEKEDDASEIGVDAVPTRIVERMPDGTYRVKGLQSFMIGKREYRVIVTGQVRPGDINGDEVASTKLIDPKFDIVSLKKEIKL